MFNKKYYNFEFSESLLTTIDNTYIFLVMISQSNSRNSLVETIGITNETERKLFVHSRLFRVEHLALYLNNVARKNNSANVQVRYLEHAIQQLIYFGIIEPIRASGLNWISYQVLPVNLRRLPNNSLLPVIYGQKYIIGEAEKSIYQICVETADGDEHAGTGFCSKVNLGENEFNLIITNKHVVDPEIYTITEIKNSSSTILFDQTQKIICCEEHDLALILIDIEESDEFVGMNLSNVEEEVLSDILTIGYPNVANTYNDTVLVHSGQINGIVNLTNGKRGIVISADVAPGNSGCPVLNELGQVIGLVTEDLESKRIDPSSKNKDEIISSIHHAAIPSNYILDFINQECNLLLEQRCRFG